MGRIWSNSKSTPQSSLLWRVCDLSRFFLNLCTPLKRFAWSFAHTLVVMDFFMKKLFGPIFILKGCVLSIQQNLRQVCAKSKHEEKKSLKNRREKLEKFLSSLKPVICIDLVKIVAIQNLYRLLCRILYEPWQCQLLGFLLLLNPTLAYSHPA